MIPKDKAIQLVNRYHELGKDFTRGVSMQEFSKECALIAVDEILNNFGSRVGDKIHYCNYLTIQYYEEVKQEIENL
jgi:hypothetical protein